MTRVRVLPDNLINQIAAGEVIERPASVVKELIENALDAGATALTVDLEKGGRRRLRVADDGHGMDADDALLALERHATSKLAAEEDLRHIRTLGFRGEALPAIASVSRLTLQSSPDGRRGTRIEVEGGHILGVREAGHPRGTTVDVRDLFFNTPARAKFLRSPATELGHVSELVGSYAAARPALRVTLMHEGRRLLDATPVAALADRLRQVHGADWEEAIPFERRAGSVRVHGLIRRPDRGTATRRNQHVHVNGRWVRDRLIGHALIAACGSYLPKDRYAGVFLFIECAEEDVDVNVHPAKAEVRFRESRIVHDLVKEAVGSALADAMPITPLVSMAGAGTGGGGGGVDEARTTPIASVGARGTAVREAGAEWMEGLRPGPAGSSPPAEGESEVGAPDRALFPGAVALAHYRQSYILAEAPEGLLLVDQHAAHERILFERLQDEMTSDRPVRQGLMFPVTRRVPRLIGGSLGETIDELGTLGFEAEPFGDDTILVRSIPAVLEGVDPDRLVEDLLEAMAAQRDEGVAPRPAAAIRDRLLATIACHAAVKVRMPLTPEKMNYLIDELFRTRSPLRCPHGRPAILRFTHRSIEQGFDRA